MKKILFLAGLLFLFAGKAHAQAEVPHFATDPPLCDNTRGLLYFNTTTSKLMSCTALNTWTAAGGGGITSVPVLPGTCTLTSAAVQLTVAPGGIYVPLFTGGVCAYALDGQIGGSLLPASFGVKANWQIESTGANFTVTSGSPTVTCTTCAFTAADTGKEMFFSNWGGSDINYPTVSVGPATATTITFVNTATVTMSQNAGFNAGTTNANAGVLYWGNNDDPVAASPWTAVENAVYNGLNCQNLQFSGITNLEKAHFLASTCRGVSGGSTASKYPGITGFGVGAGARFLLPPWFDPIGCTGATSGIACFGLGEWANVTFDTGGGVSNIVKNVNIFETFNDGSYKDLAFWAGWGATSLNSTASMFRPNGGEHIISDITADGGWIPCTVGGFVRWYSVFCANGNSNGSASPGNVNILANAELSSVEMAYSIGNRTGVAVMVNTGAKFLDFHSDTIASPGISSACIDVLTGGYYYGIGLECTNGGQTTSEAIAVSGTGYAYCSGCKLGGGATNGAWSCAATSTCEAGPGNVYSANPIGVIGCNVSSASPAACAGNSRGFVAVPTGATTYTVNTTAVTANSVITVTPRYDTTAGTHLGVTCLVTPSLVKPDATAVVAGTSFTFLLTAPAVNPSCFNYTIVN